jgi:hypothetical protein
MRLELGCGNKPTPVFIHHDKILHSDHVDLSFDLEILPWPVETNSVSLLLALDVFEHLRLEVHEWLGECWRVVAPTGVLDMRLPSYDHPQGYGFRDVTHRRLFHMESMLYFCPNTPKSTLYENFGRYYWGLDYNKWWRLLKVERDHYDCRFLMEPLKDGQ